MKISTNEQILKLLRQEREAWKLAAENVAREKERRKQVILQIVNDYEVADKAMNLLTELVEKLMVEALKNPTHYFKEGLLGDSFGGLHPCPLTELEFMVPRSGAHSTISVDAETNLYLHSYRWGTHYHLCTVEAAVKFNCETEYWSDNPPEFDIVFVARAEIEDDIGFSFILSGGCIDQLGLRETLRGAIEKEFKLNTP